MDDELTESSLRDEYPGWDIIDGIPARLKYARLRGSSPPIVVRGEDWADLRDEIVRAVGRLEQRTYWAAELEQRAADQRRFDEDHR
jgi:hypothetical protein